MNKLLRMLLPAVMLASAIPAVAGVVVVGLPADSGTANCYPFGCAYTTDYQQVYTSSQFSGPITITGLEFYNTVVTNTATSMNSGNWQISLSTTAADWNSLSNTYANNVGADNTLVFDGDLSQPWIFGDTLSITLALPFTYNPGNGNLLLDVVASGTSESGDGIFFDTNGYNASGFDGNTIMGRVYCNGCGTVSGNVNSGYGLVTGFVTDHASVPEPSSGIFLLLGSGVIGLAGLLKRKFAR